MRTRIGSSAHRECTAPSRAGYWVSIPIMLAYAVLLGFGAVPARSQTATTGSHIFSSLHGVHVVGYQGWYACPWDGAGGGWGHWFVAGSNTKDPNSIALDEWPDTSELGPDERCPT